MSKPFHQSRAWRKLAKAHKTPTCHCGSTKDIESAHYLPQKKYPLMRLWRVNLYYSCKKCNWELGDSIKWSIRSAQLWVFYWMIKAIYWLVIILYFSLTTTVMYMDISTGGMETSFTGQILIETLEQLQKLWGML